MRERRRSEAASLLLAIALLSAGCRAPEPGWSMEVPRAMSDSISVPGSADFDSARFLWDDLPHDELAEVDSLYARDPDRNNVPGFAERFPFTAFELHRKVRAPGAANGSVDSVVFPRADELATVYPRDVAADSPICVQVFGPRATRPRSVFAQDDRGESVPLVPRVEIRSPDFFGLYHFGVPPRPGPYRIGLVVGADTLVASVRVRR